MSDFKSIQHGLATYFRSPIGTIPLPIEGKSVKSRLNIYRELIHGNIASFVNDNFPKCAAILGKRKWSYLINDFIQHHDIKSPYFYDIALEFLLFLNNRHKNIEPNYILELAHFELQDIAVFMVADEPIPKGLKPFNSLKQIPFANPIMQLYSYNWPVHTIRAKRKKVKKLDAPVYLAIYRNRELNTSCIELNVPSVQLLSQVMANRKLDATALIKKINKISKSNADSIFSALKQFYNYGLILGGISKTTQRNR